MLRIRLALHTREDAFPQACLGTHTFFHALACRSSLAQWNVTESFWLCGNSTSSIREEYGITMLVSPFRPRLSWFHRVPRTPHGSPAVNSPSSSLPCFNVVAGSRGGRACSGTVEFSTMGRTASPSAAAVFSFGFYDFVAPAVVSRR